MLFKIQSAIVFRDNEMYVPSDGAFVVTRTPDGSTFGAINPELLDQSVEFIDIPNKENILHIKFLQFFNTFALTLSQDIMDKVGPHLMINGPYNQACRYSRVDPLRDPIGSGRNYDKPGADYMILINSEPSNLEKLEKFLGLEEKELSMHILQKICE